MSQPNVFPNAVFPFEYWPLEYWPVSITAPAIHGCVDLNDWLNSDVSILDNQTDFTITLTDNLLLSDVTIVDEVISTVTLTDISDGDITITDVICPN
jgi:hypothetical protein